MQWKLLGKSALIGGAVITAIILGLTSLAAVLTNLIGLPSDLGLAPVLRLTGWGVLIGGAALGLWLLRYRSPTTMIVSTYFTFVKMFRRSPVSDLGGRTEPLVVKGPQRYVRNPLYLAAATIFLGWTLITDSTSSLVGLAFILAWFRFVQIPFEENELRTIFGEQWVSYSMDVPMLLPFRRRRHDHALPG